jgi:hypothetical protein
MRVGGGKCTCRMEEGLRGTCRLFFFFFFFLGRCLVEGRNSGSSQVFESGVKGIRG